MGGCGCDLRGGRTCDGFRLCPDCFVATEPKIDISHARNLAPAERAVVDALAEHAPRLRGLGHNYVELDANARYYVARLAVAALRAEGWAKA